MTTTDQLAREKIAPVQGYTPGIPWSLHLEAYDAYRKKWGPQPALIDLEGRNCRGGFGTSELDEFVPGWRDKVSEIGKLRARVAELELALAAYRSAEAQGEAAEGLAKPHELDGVPMKVLKELSNSALGDYITHLKNQARELTRVTRERDDAHRGCKRLRELLDAHLQPAKPQVEAEIAIWRWRHKDTKATGVYEEHPSKFGVDIDNPDYEWTRFVAQPAQRVSEWRAPGPVTEGHPLECLVVLEALRHSDGEWWVNGAFLDESTPLAWIEDTPAARASLGVKES